MGTFIVHFNLLTIMNIVYPKGKAHGHPEDTTVLKSKSQAKTIIYKATCMIEYSNDTDCAHDGDFPDMNVNNGRSSSVHKKNRISVQIKHIISMKGDQIH